MGTGRRITQSEEAADGQVVLVRHVGLAFAPWLHRELSALAAKVVVLCSGMVQSDTDDKAQCPLY